jgi:hypothetical protein
MECVVTESIDKNRDKLIPWNTWEENKPATVEDHIEQYRKSLTKLRSASEEIAHEPDFFNVRQTLFASCIQHLFTIFFLEGHDT